MTGGAPALEQAGRAEHQRAGAHGCHVARRRRLLAQKFQRRLIFHEVLLARAAGHHHHVERRTIGIGDGRHDLHTAIGRHSVGGSIPPLGTTKALKNLTL